MLEIIYIILSAFGVLALLAGIYFAFAEFSFQRKYSRDLKENFSYEPSVSVIAPTKGPEPGLEKKIRSIISQNYPKEKVQYIFVLDSKDDPAHDIIKKLIRKNMKIVIAKPLPRCSGKISALLSGIGHAKNEVLVFADTDGFVRNNWLRSLASRLEIADVSSGIRFYLPGKTWKSYIRSSWNSAAINLIFGKWKFVMGSSFAIRRKDFDRLRVADTWKHAISDDLSLTTKIKEAGMRISHAPQCVLYNADSFRFKDFLEFSNRQTIIMKSCIPGLHKLGFFLMPGRCFLMLLGIVSLALGIYLPAALMLSLVPLYVLKEYIAFRGYGKNIHVTGNQLKYAIAGVSALFISAYNVVVAFRRNTVVWRGRRYKINGPEDVEILETKSASLA